MRAFAVAAVVVCAGPSDAAAEGPLAATDALVRVDYGLSTAKRANCMGCHKWHGDGGPGYGGAAISLRKTRLARAQLVELIRCGRPGTNMPYFDRDAYKDDRCYGLTFDDFANDDDNRPLQGKKYLNERQVNAVADFVIAELQGKEVTKAYCEKYFGGPTRQCEAIGSP
ncbi:MAG TPA: cytochrome c [Gammaproteobacteria bacterium]|nr:cytochrome c [Gammaproteobacteria bacterium]